MDNRNGSCLINEFCMMLTVCATNVACNKVVLPSCKSALNSTNISKISHNAAYYTLGLHIICQRSPLEQVHNMYLMTGPEGNS